MTLTIDQLTIRLNSLEKDLNVLYTLYQNLKSDTDNNVKTSDLATSEASILSQVQDANKLINNLENRLSQISTPSETRYYLEEAEVENFRSNFNKLLAMMSEFQSLYNSLVAFSAKNTE